MFDMFLNCGAIVGFLFLLVSMTQLWRSQQRIQFRLRELDLLRSREAQRQQRLVELSRHNAAHQFEAQWFNCLVPEQQAVEQLLSLLTQSAENPREFQAWILNSLGEIIAQNEVVKTLDATISIDRKRLRNPPEETFTLTPSSAGSDCSEVVLIPCGTHSESPHFLCLSDVPKITGDFSFDGDLLAKLCCNWNPVVNDSNASAPPDDEFELTLIRDILMLRTLTDDEYESPQVMLQEFLKKLASLTGFERASFMSRTNHGYESWRRLATGGISLNTKDFQAWNESEIEILESAELGRLLPLWLDRSSSNDGATSLPLPTCLIVQAPQGSSSGSTLILSSRTRVTRNRIQEELAKWSAEFLPVSFDKALSRLQVEERARRDSLTQVANRHAFDAAFQKILNSSAANQSPASLLLIDVDHFKLINDNYGHVAGDAILRSVAETISHVVHQTRITDHPLVARYGGEEFAVLLPEVSIQGAARIAEEVRMEIERRNHRFNSKTMKVTVSIGVAGMPTRPATTSAVLQATDEALYAAKRQGRNRTVVSPVKVEERADPQTILRSS